VPEAALVQLGRFLAAYDERVEALAQHVLAEVDQRLPGAHRMVYDNFNATVVGYSPDGKSRHSLCSVAAYPRWVNLFLFVGPGLATPTISSREPGPRSAASGCGSRPTSTSAGELVDATIASWPWPYDPYRSLTTDVISVSDRRRARRPKAS